MAQVRRGDPHSADLTNHPAFTGGPPFCMSPALVRGLLEPRGLEAAALDEVPAAKLARGGFAKEWLGRWRKKQEGNV